MRDNRLQAYLGTFAVLGVLLVTTFGWAGMEDRIGPAPSPQRQSFNCRDASLWSNIWTDRPPVPVGEDGGVLVFDWQGGIQPVLVQSSEKLQVESGFQGEVRTEWEIAIEDPEFAAQAIPVMSQFDAQGKPIGDVELRDEWQATAPERFRIIGLTWKPWSDGQRETKYVSPGLKFNGNRMRVRLRAVHIDPAPVKPTWRPRERPSSRIPEVRYEVDECEPSEDAAQCSPEEVTNLLARRSKAVARVERWGDGVQLIIDGRPVPPVVHMAPYAGPVAGHYAEIAAAGFDIATITVKTGPKADTPAAPGNIWLGEKKYDFEPVREAIRYVLARAPGTYIMLNMIVNVYNDWGLEHPGDLHANSEGKPGICSWSRVTRYGGPPPGPNEFWEASNHSEQFREDASEMLRDLAHWLDSVPEGKVVIGAYLNGSADGQWLFSDELQFADYSEGALRAFREYLREKYRDEQALSEAWGFAVTFDTAAIPAYPARGRSKDGTALLSFNGRDAQAADYNAFLSVSNTRRQIAFCKAFKEGSKGRFLCGSYWPTLPAAYPLSHGDFWEMLNSPYVDFVSRGGLLGAAFHGKLTLGEFDLRNVKSGLESWIAYDDRFIAKSQGEFKRQLAAGICRELAAGGGFHLFDMWGGWFWHPETMAIISKALTVTEWLKESPSLGEDYVGVFVDEDAANHLTHLGRYYLIAAVENTCESMGWGWAHAWGRTGLPVRFFLMQDALNPKLTVPRVAIFLNPLTMSLEQAEGIRERFCRDGRVVVYMLAPGLAAPGHEDNPSRITGFAIRPDQRTRNRPLTVVEGDDPLLQGIRPGSVLCPWRTEMGYYVNFATPRDGPGEVLAQYAGTDIPGMVVERRKQHTVVWSGFPGALSPAFVRNLAREAGMTPLLENDNELIIGQGLLAVVGVQGGPQEVTLPRGYQIEKCLTGHAYQVRGEVLTFDLLWGDIYGDTAVFAVKGR